MKSFSKYLIALVALAGAATAVAQDSSSSSSIVRRRAGDRDRNASRQAPGVTDRMQQFYSKSSANDADLMWMRVIYRDLEMDNPKNAALYYPEDVVDGQENLFRIIMRLLADNAIPAYEYLDGKEIFTDQYRLKVSDMLERFHVLYSPAKGSTEKNPRFVIEESDVPANEIRSYYILERWEFDAKTNKTRRLVEAICPVLHRADEFGVDAVRYPMFWVKLDAIRPYLAQQYIFIDDDNNLPRYTYDDFFTMAMYDGDIYKTRNLTNRSMMPSREEVIAAREAREAAEAEAAAKAEGQEIADRDGAPADTQASESRTSRGRRGSATTAKKSNAKKAATKKTKVRKPKAPKSSSAGAARSVRRRK